MRRTVLLLTAMAVAMLLASGAALLAASPPTGVASAQTKVKPNLLVVMIDDADLETLRDTPRLRSITQGKGVSFSESFVTNPLCCPSRATFLRGQYSHNTGVTSNGLPNGGYPRFEQRGNHKDNVVTRLKRSGYRTFMVGKYMNGFNNRSTPPGWDRFIQTGFFRYKVDNASWQPLPENVWFDDRTGEVASRLIRNQASVKGPFFGWVSFHSPHAVMDGGKAVGYVPPKRHKGKRADASLEAKPSRFEKDLSDKPRWLRDRVAKRGEVNPERVQQNHQSRVEMLEGIADNMKKILTALQQSRQYNNTYILFTNDNGFLLGEHHLTAKSWPYEESIRVPLAIRGPGVPAGVVRREMVTNNDIAPTLLRWARLAQPNYMDGRALQPLLSTAPTSTWTRKQILIENADESNLPPYKAIRTREGKIYIEYSNMEREYYDLKKDPYQLNNTFSQSPAQVKELSKRLQALKACKWGSCRSAENVR